MSQRIFHYVTFIVTKYHKESLRVRQTPVLMANGPFSQDFGFRVWFALLLMMFIPIDNNMVPYGVYIPLSHHHYYPMSPSLCITSSILQKYTLVSPSKSYICSTKFLEGGTNINWVIFGKIRKIILNTYDMWFSLYGMLYLAFVFSSQKLFLWMIWNVTRFCLFVVCYYIGFVVFFPFFYKKSCLFSWYLVLFGPMTSQFCFVTTTENGNCMLFFGCWNQYQTSAFLLRSFFAFFPQLPIYCNTIYEFTQTISFHFLYHGFFFPLPGIVFSQPPKHTSTSDSFFFFVLLRSRCIRGESLIWRQRQRDFLILFWKYSFVFQLFCQKRTTSRIVGMAAFKRIRLREN